MEILFSNGTDKLQITLPDRTLAAEEWFTAPLALQVGGLNFYISNDYFSRRIIALLSAPILIKIPFSVGFASASP